MVISCSCLVVVEKERRNTENKSIMAELVIVDCVSMLHEEEKGGENYRKKNKFW